MAVIHDPYRWAEQSAQSNNSFAERDLNSADNMLLSLFKTEAGRQQPYVELPAQQMLMNMKTNEAIRLASAKEAMRARRASASGGGSGGVSGGGDVAPGEITEINMAALKNLSEMGDAGADAAIRLMEQYEPVPGRASRSGYLRVRRLAADATTPRTRVPGTNTMTVKDERTGNIVSVPIDESDTDNEDE